MILPLTLIFFAFTAAAVVAYGNNPAWVSAGGDIGFILFSRRFQWLLVFVSVAFCVSLIVLIISGKRRAWWLIGLGPVLALFIYRFSTGAMNQWGIAEEPGLVTSDRASFVKDADHVVGLVFQDSAYAYPYAHLYATPVVVQSDYDKRFLLMWSPFANRAVAWQIDREVKGRDLEIISMPANALLLYDSRLGVFINGLTGQTTTGTTPVGFKSQIPTTRTTWGQWRAMHPKTKLMLPARAQLGPSKPLAPRYRMPSDVPENQRGIAVAVAWTSAGPVAVQAEDKPINAAVGDVPLVVFRDPSTRQLRAFDRRIDDLTPKFSFNPNTKRAGVLLIDSDTDTGWSATGAAVDGDKTRRGKKLAPLIVEDDLYWGVMKFWYPNLPVAGDK
jgi:hypothetical protein